jgi:hypothetical protein
MSTVLSLLVMNLLAQTPLVLTPDPARDSAIHAHFRDFFDGKLTDSDFESELRKYVAEFEARPYRIAGLPPDAMSFDKDNDHLLRFGRIAARIMRPTMEVFQRGEMDSARAALKLAPLLLMFGGYGIEADPDAGASPEMQRRTRELMDKIGDYAASGKD